MPPCFIIIFENDCVLMNRGNINLPDSPPAELRRPYFLFDVVIFFRQCSGEGQSEAGSRLLQKDPQSRQPGCERIWGQAGRMFFEISFPIYAIPSTFLFLPFSLIPSPSFFLRYYNLCFHYLLCSPGSGFLLLKKGLTYPLSSVSISLSILPLEVGGLSEKIGPLLSKADRQPHDPGAKGELSTQLHLASVKAHSLVVHPHTLLEISSQ